MKPGSALFPEAWTIQKIRGLLLSAAKDPSDPGLRAETVDILNSSAQSADVRDALIYALLHDQNAGVRLKAMEGLKPFAQQPEVRTAMTQVLLTDSNPGMRTQAIDLLTKSLNQDNPAMSFDRQVIGAHAGADAEGKQRIRAAALQDGARIGEGVIELWKTY